MKTDKEVVMWLRIMRAVIPEHGEDFYKEYGFSFSPAEEALAIAAERMNKAVKHRSVEESSKDWKKENGKEKTD